MKTIKEAATDHVKTHFSGTFTTQADPRESFNAGVEFAQRWIPVEEELPDNLTDVLIKQSNGKISIGCLMFSSFNVEMENKKIQVTYWRPIERI